MVTMTTTRNHDLTELRAALQGAERNLAVARTADVGMRPAGAGTIVTRLRALETEEAVLRAETAVGEIRRQITAAETAEADERHASRRPGRVSAIRQAFEAASAFAEALARLAAFDEETSRLAGRRDDSIFGGLRERIAFERERAARAGWL